MEKKPFFKIHICLDRLFFITFALTYLFVILTECGFFPFSRQGYSIIALSFIFFSLIRFEIRETPVSDIFISLFNSFIFTLLFQLMLSCDPKLLNVTTFIGNVALNASLTFFLLLITNRIRPSITISNVLLFFFAFVEYMVISFRGSEIKLSDFYSLRTGISVVSQYKLEFTSVINYSIFVLVLSLFLIWITKFTHKSKKSQLPRISGVLFLGATLFTVSWCMNHSNNYMQLWGFEGTKHNGLTYNFLIEARDSRVVPPENYSEENVEKILNEEKVSESKNNTPNIVVIMSEAFSDLSVLGALETDVDPITYYKSLTDNTVKGYALSSVLGGNTAVSEWEFLTGNTQAFLPYGSVAYQQYIKNRASSIVGVLNENDYTTIAMHPYLSTGWKRNVVFDVFGFDEVYFMDDLSSDGRIRGFVSDKTLFADVIKRFENKKDGEKIFNFCITMQNHGGYDFGNFPPKVNYKAGQFYSVNQYLTLLYESDAALKMLIEYFENYDEDTMIVLFGDHQPSFPPEFYNDIMGNEASTFVGVQKKHTVPFMIWTNYDQEEEFIELTSINYLSTIMLEKAGIGLTPYFSYLSDLREKLPALNFYGYFSKSEDSMLRTSNATDDEKKLIEEYKALQYYNIFDS